jgi:hypothetical protein
MNSVIKNRSKKRPPPHGTTARFILLGPGDGLRRQFRGFHSAAYCEAGKIRDVLPLASRNSLWISPGARTTDKLLRGLAECCAARPGRRSSIGSIFMLEPPRSRVVPILHGLFDKVIGESPSFKMLPHDQLADVLSAPEEEARDLFVGGIEDVTSGTLALVRGNLERLNVPLAVFRPSGRTRPDFRRFELDDYGQTIRFGRYEAAADAILYEVDADYRKRLHARSRAEEKGFGPSLRRLRLQRGLARDAFPGIAAKTIARLERGEVSKPQGRTLQTLAATLEVEADQIESY